MPSASAASPRGKWAGFQQDEYLRSLGLQRLTIDEKWADIHFVYVIIFSMLCILMESMLFVCFEFFGGGVSGRISPAEYISLYIFLPSVSFFVVILAMSFVRAVTIDIRARALAYSYAGAATFFIIYIVHSRWPGIDIGLILPLMATVGYASVLLTSLTALGIIAARIVADFWVLGAFPHAVMRVTYGDMESMLNFFLGMGLIGMAWIMCVLFIFVEKTRENEIRRSDRERAEMFRRAMTDPLTGIGNRFAMRLTFDEIIQNGTQQYCAAVMMDMDHFKSINDELGHDVGDRYIKTMAGILAGIHDASVFRFGGDEFCMIFYGGVSRAEAACREIARRLSKSDVCREIRTITMSAGIAAWTDGITPSELLKRADTALYTAKETRGRAVVYAPHAEAFPGDAEMQHYNEL